MTLLEMIVPAIANIFAKDTLVVFAFANLYTLLIRTQFLRWEMSDIRYRDERNNSVMRKVGVRFPCWFFSAVAAAFTYATAIHWPDLIAVGLLFLFFIALLLYGQIYFRKAHRSLLLMRKRKLEKLGI